FSREAFDVGSQARDRLRKGFRVLPGPDLQAKAGIVPPSGVKTRARADDAFALLRVWRQGPLRRNAMRLAKVFEQQVPLAGLGVPLGVETPGHQTGPHHAGHVVVERDFLPAARPRTAGTIEQARLQDERARRAGARAVISEAQAEDVRENRR